MVVQLDKIYFEVNGERVFPFKVIEAKKNAREARVSELESLLKTNNKEKIKTDSKEFQLIAEWLGLQKDDLT